MPPLQNGGRYLCADNTRFWCMFAVVAMHCTRVFSLSAGDDSPLFYAFAVPFKFGTIGFFLVSGFLLKKSLDTSSAVQLLTDRARKILIPWAFWCALYLFILTVSDFLQHRGPFAQSVTLLEALRSEFNRGLVMTPLWFVPNLLFGLVILLLFRRWLKSPWLGCALLAANLFYTANVYAEWIVPDHPRALFAFVFYLWLGQYAARHHEALARLLSRVSLTGLAILTTVSAVCAFAECRLLLHLHSSGPLNTLRPFNQVFSVLAVLCLVKLPRPAWPRFVDVPRHMFGMYLSHAIIAGALLSMARRVIESHAIGARPALSIALWLAVTVCAWTTGLLVSRKIAGTPSLCWMQGLKRSPSPPKIITLGLAKPGEAVALLVG